MSFSLNVQGIKINSMINIFIKQRVIYYLYLFKISNNFEWLFSSFWIIHSSVEWSILKFHPLPLETKQIPSFGVKMKSRSLATPFIKHYSVWAVKNWGPDCKARLWRGGVRKWIVGIEQEWLMLKMLFKQLRSVKFD